jgi:DNA uptake protein ComE-like DNA-binding protein
MFRFDWADLMTDELLALVAQPADLGAGDLTLSIHRTLSDILAAVGGLPFADHQYSTEERTNLANNMIHDAIKHTLYQICGNPRAPGYVATSSPLPEISQLLTSVEKVPVNRAMETDIAQLPEIGAVIAQRIVEARKVKGRFGTLTELNERVEGVGDAIVRAVEHALYFDQPEDLLHNEITITGDFTTDLATLLALQPGSSGLERLESALDMALTACVGHSHPFTMGHLVRTPLAPLAETTDHADWVGILFGSDYYRHLPDLLQQAQTAIDICMFHIALPTENHPTLHLLEALVAAHERGITVRVLLDQDRPNDPYNSVVINTPAKNFLEQRGVTVKFDQADRLLHSKYILIDSTLTVVGSHNWSAGSYFQMDDLSLVLSSSDLTARLRGRFESLWSNS